MLIILLICVLALMVLVLGYFVIANAKRTSELELVNTVRDLDDSLTEVMAVQAELDEAQAKMDETIREIDNELSHVRRILSEIDSYLKSLNSQKGHN